MDLLLYPPTSGSNSICVATVLLEADILPMQEPETRLTRAANEQIGFRHPENMAWNHISSCQFAGLLGEEDGVISGVNVVASSLAAASTHQSISHRT